jgi:hypothetical protein
VSQEHPVVQRQNPTSQFSVRLLHKPQKSFCELLSQIQGVTSNLPSRVLGAEKWHRGGTRLTQN